MDIVVASRNPVKIDAVKQAFAIQFSSTTLNLIPIDVESGVNFLIQQGQHAGFAGFAACRGQ